MLEHVTLLGPRELPGHSIYNQVASAIRFARTNTPALRISAAPDGGLLISLFPKLIDGLDVELDEAEVKRLARGEIHSACLDGGEIHELVESLIEDALEQGGDIADAIEDAINAALANIGTDANHPFSIVVENGRAIVCYCGDTSSANAGDIICGSSSYACATTSFALPASGTMSIYASITYANGAFSTAITVGVPQTTPVWYACIGAVDSQGNVSQSSVDFFNLRVTERWVP